MSSTTLIKPPPPPAADPPPTFGELLWQILPLIGVVAVAGPPVVLLIGPLLLGVLMLIGPFALIATLVLVVVVAVVLAAALVEVGRAIAATPATLARHVRTRRVGVEPRLGAK